MRIISMRIFSEEQTAIARLVTNFIADNNPSADIYNALRVFSNFTTPKSRKATAVVRASRRKPDTSV